MNGTYDYALLKGDTGPLVYPAGFVWIFTAFYHLTAAGTNIRVAQYLFLGLYIAFLGLVFRILLRSEKLPPYALAFLSLASYRVHSIFVLRLFNDPVAMLLLYAAVNAFIDDRWSVGSALFSLAVSVKMNVLLFAPALFFAYLATLGVAGTVLQLAICAAIQVLLAVPFLLENPLNYLVGAFNLGRVFFFEWTVNWRFLPEEVFVDKRFHLALLALHAVCLLICIPRWWKMLKSYATLAKNEGPSWSVQLLLLPLFMSNFIGLVFARSLHYQFYVWYFHQIPYLLWCVKMPTVARLCLLGLVELCWNTFPSTDWSSGLLHGCHLVILVGLLVSIFSMAGEQTAKDKRKAN